MRKIEKKHICAGCGNKFSENEIEFSPDPYAEEINGNDTKVWECKDCRDSSAFDI